MLVNTSISQVVMGVKMPDQSPFQDSCLNCWEISSLFKEGYCDVEMCSLNLWQQFQDYERSQAKGKSGERPEENRTLMTLQS